MPLSLPLAAEGSAWLSRARASAVHLGLSIAVAAPAGALVFGIWYPYPYRETSGGRELFSLLVAIDVVVGPLITLMIFDVRKPWPMLRRDLIVVAILQMLALGYGLWTVYAARPVHLVFEYQRFAVVHAIEVAPEALAQAPATLRSLPMWGPTPLSLRAFRDNKEQTDVTMAAMSGMPVSAQAALWRDYDAARAEVLREARPLAELRARFPAQAALVDRAVTESGRVPSDLVWLPMIDRRFFWTVLLDRRDAAIAGFLPLDPY